MRYRFHLLKLLLLFFFTISLYSDNNLKKISVQLEWKHQFEFAGFYAAVEKGYYKDIGLEVELKEFQDDIKILDNVLDETSTFGISSSSLILERLKDKPVVLLSSFFKQNALAIISQKDIKTVEQLKGKKLMALDWEIEHTSVGLMLKDKNLNKNNFELIEHDYKIDKFINGEIDAMTVFLTSQPYELDKQNIQYNILNPSSYGIFSYDVELFSSKKFIEKNPILVREFIEATNKGWRYAFENKNEIVDLIYEKYTQRKTKESLKFEAGETEKFFKTNIFKIGSLVPELVKLNIDMYVKLGLANPNYNLEKLFNDYLYNYEKYTNKNLHLTAEELSFLKNHPIVTIAMSNNFKPFSFVYDGSHQGLSNDILQKISKISGLKFEKIIDTWSSSLKRFKNKEVDMISGITHTKKREEFSLFTKPYFEIPTYVFGLKGDNSYKNIMSLKGKKVAISKDIFYKETLEKLGVDVVELKSSNEKVDALVFNQVDYFLSSYTSGQKAINSKAITRVIPIAELIDIKKEDLRFGINKDKKILYSIINKSMAKINEMEYSRIVNKWMMNLYKTDSLNEKRIYLTQEEQNYLNKKKEIRYCADPMWMPLEAIKNGEINGISSDYVKIFSEAIDIPFKLVETDSWTQSIEYAKEKKCDILSFLAMETKNRKKYLNFTTPYMQIPLVIATKYDVTFVTDFNSLGRKKIGIPKGYAFYDVLKEKYPKMNLVEVENNIEGLTKVKNGEFFGFVGTLASVGYLFQTQFVGELKIAGKFDENWEFAVALRNDDQILLNIMQKTLESIDEETRKNIFNKWIAIKYESKVDYEFLWETIFVALLIFLVFIYWNRRLRILNSQLEYQKNQAQNALAIKSNFLANITHEIRTPMNVILGMTYLVQKSIVDEKQKGQLKNIEKATKSLLRLINDILDSSKIEVGKLEVIHSNFSLLTILDNISLMAQSNIEDKDIEFKISYDDEIPLNLYGDNLRIEQVLTNLVSNAIKFTQKGSVEVSIKNIKHNKYRFCVKDTGIGISKEQIENVFEAFTQADDSITRKYGGTGLGLSISKQLVELMGGEIYITSKEGVGTKLFFEIELEKAKNDIDAQELLSTSQSKLSTLSFFNKRKKMDKDQEWELIESLKESVYRKRPKLAIPIIEEFDKHILGIMDTTDFKNVKIYIKKYMFKEASEILDKYGR